VSWGFLHAIIWFHLHFSRASSIRSVHTVCSTQSHLPGPVSPACLVLSGIVAGLFLNFALNPQARHYVRPNRVRKPATDCMFASGCSPPHLAVTQLPPATGIGHLPEEDFHLPDRACFQAHGFPPSRE
jgi:hypothetical protein